MLDISWSEMAVIALVALVILGPKELPGALRAVTQLLGKMRSLAREFQRGIDDIVRESEIKEARDAMKDMEKGLRQEIMDAEGHSIEPKTPAPQTETTPKAVAADTDSPSPSSATNESAPAAKANDNA